MVSSPYFNFSESIINKSCNILESWLYNIFLIYCIHIHKVLKPRSWEVSTIKEVVSSPYFNFSESIINKSCNILESWLYHIFLIYCIHIHKVLKPRSWEVSTIKEVVSSPYFNFSESIINKSCNILESWLYNIFLIYCIHIHKVLKPRSWEVSTIKVVVSSPYFNFSESTY